ncbi:MAG TPA: efflux RND transporter permease subunit, partial [Sediminibacterium sp.]
TPALCALMLRHPGHNKKKRSVLQKFFDGFNKRYNQLSGRYAFLITRIAGRRLVTLLLLAVFFVCTWGFNRILPSGFIPTEDQGMIYVNVTTPPGATLERTEDVLHEIQKAASKMKPVESVSMLAGYSLMSDMAGASYGMGMINLKAWDERKESVDAVIAELEKASRHIPDASIQFFPPPTVPGFGNASGFELRLLDRSGSDNLQKMADVTTGFMNALARTPGITNVFTGFDPNFPQYMLHVDQEMAAKKGVTIENALNTLQTLLGSYYTTNFIRFGQMYKVMLQAAPQYRAKPEDVLTLYVKSSHGEMVPYSAFVRLERVYGPEQLMRYNMYTSAMINGEAAPDYSSSDAIAAVEKTAKENLPKGYSIEWSGMTREEILSGNQSLYIFLICLLFVYLLLAAQYESLLLPLPVILSLPAGIFGSFLFLKLAGLENNIYAQVALVMLIGLLGKNAILIVEFAIQRNKEGMGILQAAAAGAVSRLRPILMTSFAFIAGLVPLCIATGAGAMGNRSIGTAAAGGMLTGTLFGIIIVPGLYVLFASIGRSAKRKPSPAPAVLPDTNTDIHPTPEQHS